MHKGRRAGAGGREKRQGEKGRKQGSYELFIRFDLK